MTVFFSSDECHDEYVNNDHIHKYQHDDNNKQYDDDLTQSMLFVHFSQRCFTFGYIPWWSRM